MGKKIDRFVLSVLAAGGFYLYFYRAAENHTIALILAGISFLLLRRMLCRIIAKIRNSIWMKRRILCRQMNGTLMKLACADALDVEKSISTLIQKGYGGQYPLEIVQMHPASQLSAENIFEIWKKHRGEEHLVICATCRCSAENRSLCKSLKQPKLALLDAGALGQLIAEHPEDIFVQEENPKRIRLPFKRLPALLLRRKNAPRCLVFSASMLMMYLLSANIAYLAAAMFLLFTALASLHKASRPSKLF